MRNYHAVVVVSVFCLSATVARAQETAPNRIPTDFGFAIGAGVTIPSDILNFNRFTAKARVAGLEIAPFVNLGMSSTNTVVEATAAGTTTKTENSTGGTGIGLGSDVFIPVMAGHNIELQAVGSLTLSRNGSSNDPNGPDNNSTSSTMSVFLGYGVAIEWWFASHISFTATATNTLVSLSTTTTDQEQGANADTMTKSSASQFGLVWNPTVGGTFNVWF